MTSSPPHTDLDALSGLLENATPGPWSAPIWDAARAGVFFTVTGQSFDTWATRGGTIRRDRDMADGALITAAVNALPSIISELTRARSDLAAKERRIEDLEAEIAEREFIAKYGNRHLYVNDGETDKCVECGEGWTHVVHLSGEPGARATLEDRG